MTSTDWTLAALVVVTLAAIILATSYLVARARKPSDAERFQREPRVGDRASYVVHITATHRRWVVGQVTDAVKDELGWRVRLEVPYTTALGEYRVPAGWWSIDHLEYEPADTELGVHEARL